MPDAKFSLFSINVPDYIILRARKTSAPGAEVARSAPLGPAPVGNLNFLVPGLDPVNHFFDVYESVDGTALNTLLGTFTWDVEQDMVIEEDRYYVVDSGINNSPSNGDTSIVDAYLIGKNVTRIEKRSIGPMVPSALGFAPEWSIDPTTGTIAILGGLTFASLETYVATIQYAQPVPTSASNSFFADVKTVTDAAKTLNNTYRNNRIRCVAAGTQQVITFEDIGGIPDGTFWLFTHHDGGAQYNTTFVFPDANLIYAGGPYSEFWIGKGETIWIEKRGAQYEIVQEPVGAASVGRRSAESLPYIPGVTGFPNLFPEDNTLWDADDLPRMYYWLTHAFPNANYYISDDNLDQPGYVRPTSAGQPWKTGMFIISTTKRKFRMPDTQGFGEKGSKSFDTFGADGSRLYDYPGGLQLQQLMTHVHNNGIADDKPQVDASSVNVYPTTIQDMPGLARGQLNNGSGGTIYQGETSRPKRSTAVVYDIDGAEQRVNNFSVIYYRHA